MGQKLLLLLIFVTIPLSSGAEVLTAKGEVFDLSGKKKFYDFQRYTGGSDQKKVLKNIFKDMKGQVVVEEKASLKGDALLNYKMTQNQTGESGEISLSGKKVHFVYKKKDGTLKKATEDLDDNFIIGMTLVPHLKKNWEKLSKGDSLRTRLGVWNRAETVGFKFWKKSYKKINGKEAMVVVMKPTSFVIRALVDPLYLTFDKATKELLSIRGRTSPKVQKDGKWKDFDAFISYSRVH